MSFKTFWKESSFAFVVKRVMVAMVIVVVLAWLTLFLLDRYTHHGESVKVPDLQGLFFAEAESLLAQMDLYAEVIDSMYVKDKPLGSIVQQTPSPDLTVKKNRAIYLVINKKQVYMVPLPRVTDVSLRQAEAILNSIGLRISNIIYQPSEFKDLVIDMTYRGEQVEEGTRIPEGAGVVLTVGSGMGSAQSAVPNLIGLPYTQARNITLDAMFVIGSVDYDFPPDNDEDVYIVYRQSPAYGGDLPTGSRINIWLTKDSDKVLNADIENEDDDPFF